MTLLLLAVAFAEEDDSIPDAGVDDDSDEVSLNQEVGLQNILKRGIIRS